MTQQIRALEESIGFFYQDKHHVELTPAGRVFMNEAKAILSRSEEAAFCLGSAAEGFSGTISIGFIRL